MGPGGHTGFNFAPHSDDDEEDEESGEDQEATY